MTRLSGIQLLAASFVLWALAVWIFGTPLPAETEPATQTTARTTGETSGEPGTEANASPGAAPAPDSAAPAQEGTTASSDSSTGTGDSLPGAASEPDGVGAVSTASPAEVPATPGSATQAPEDRDPTTGTATAPPSTGAESLAAIPPMRPGDSAPATTGDDAFSPDAPPASAPPHPWLEHPLSRPPPRPRYPAADDDPATAQIESGRRAAWEGRYADALAHYRAAARLRPDHYVVWGEMGNVLWAMRRWPEAAYALEGAATLLVRAGELRAASELVPAVGRIDGEAAYRLQQLLWAAAQRQSG